MGTTASEPCIYDKLSESVDILRQSGYRCGMSEREIERFIKQFLESNEPRREPPQFPILRATIKVVVVGFLLLMALAFTYPQRTPQMGPAASGSCNWSSPLSHVRLLSLPVAKKYNLQGFHERWGAGHHRVNCSVSADTYSAPRSLRADGGARLLQLKGGESPAVQRRRLEELYLAHADCLSTLMEADGDGVRRHSRASPAGAANFTLLRRFRPGTREKVLRWLLPKAELGPLLRRCLLTHRTSAPGKAIYAHPGYWKMELHPSPDQNITCAVRAPGPGPGPGPGPDLAPSWLSRPPPLASSRTEAPTPPLEKQSSYTP